MDRLLHALDQRGEISFVVAETSESCREAESQHLAGRIPAMVLAKTLTGTALISSWLKDGEKQSVQIGFNGELRSVLCEANAEGHLRGYAVESALPELDAAGASYVAALGTQASMRVIRSRQGAVLYTGACDVRMPGIRQAFDRYLLHSEQVAAVCELCAIYREQRMARACGVLARLMPGGSESTFEAIRERFDRGEAFEALGKMSEADDDASGIGVKPNAHAQELIRGLYPECGDLRVTERPLVLRCGCDRTRVTGMLAALGANELESLLEQEGYAEITCTFCSRVYEVDAEELRAMIRRLR